MNSPISPLDFEDALQQTYESGYVSCDSSSLEQRKQLLRIYDAFHRKVVEGFACWMNRGPAVNFAQWERLLSRRELIVWEVIRILGVPLWPRYEIPSWGVLSFANPIAKVAVLCDSRVPEVREWPACTDLEKHGWMSFWIRSRDIDAHPVIAVDFAQGNPVEPLEKRIAEINQSIIQRAEALKKKPMIDSRGNLSGYTWSREALVGLRQAPIAVR